METPELLKREIDRAIRTLVTAQQYGYAFTVHTPEGVTHGGLVAAPPKSSKHKRHNTHRPGELKAIYQPHLQKLQAGELVVFNTSPFPPESMRAAAGAYCTELWGKGSYTSYVDHEAGAVQIMRVS